MDDAKISVGNRGIGDMVKTARIWVFVILASTALAACSWDDILRSTAEGAKSACRYQDNCTVQGDPAR